MSDFLTGATVMPVSGLPGGSWADDSPDRIVLHTTEGSSIAGAFAAYTAAGSAPHFTYDASADRLAQHLSMNTSAYALVNAPGGVQTNRTGRCIQIELIGFATAAPDWPADDNARIGRLLKRIHDEGGVDFQYVAPEFLPYPASYGRTRVRMSFDEWTAFNGVCGHEHVPENYHGDPGAIRINEVLAAAGGGPPQEDDLTQATYVRRTGNAQVFILTDDGVSHPVASFNDTEEIYVRTLGVKIVNSQYATAITDPFKQTRPVWELSQSAADTAGLPR